VSVDDGRRLLLDHFQCQATEGHRNRDHERPTRGEENPLAKQVEIAATGHLPLQHLDLVVVAFDGTRAVAEADAGDDGIEVLAESGDKGVQSGEVVGLDARDPLIQDAALSVVHELGERAGRSSSGQRAGSP
jgi:hypothetical protein